jgi:hypothetical protein
VFVRRNGFAGGFAGQTGLITGMGLAAATGAAAGAWLAWLLPELALFRGCRGGPALEILPALTIAGAALAVLFARLLQWAGDAEDGPPLRAALLPWAAALFPALAWALPETYYRQNITTFGGIRYLLAAAWLLGSAIHVRFLLKPLTKSAVPWRIAAGWTVAALLVSFPVAVQPPSESDEADYVAAALAVCRDGTTRVRPAVTDGHLADFYFGQTPPNWKYYEFQSEYEPEDLNEYSYRMVGYPVVLAPFVAAAREVHEPAARWWIAYMPGLAGYFALMLALARQLANRGRAGAATLAAFATMTPFLYYPTNTQPEIWMAAAMAWSVYHLENYLEGRSGPFAFAAVTTLSMLLHERMVVLALPLAAIAALRGRERGKLLLACALCFLPVAISFAATLQFRWPEHLPHAYGQESSRFYDPARWLEAARQHIFSIRIGVFTHVPPLLALGGLFLSRRSTQLDSAADATRQSAVIALSVYALVLLTYPHTFDSWPHVRYVIPALPLLSLSLCEAIERLEFRSWGPRLVAALIVIQLLCDWAYLAIPPLWRVVSLYN